jgi:apolipoprotein N-acyltransferase
MNLVFLILVLCVTFKSIRSTIGKKENKQNLRWIMGSISLTFILGITWVFGFLYFGQGTMIFAYYVFTILNSLQGLFIFITLCVMNKKVRRDLVRQFVTSQVSHIICFSAFYNKRMRLIPFHRDYNVWPTASILS